MGILTQAGAYKYSIGGNDMKTKPTKKMTIKYGLRLKNTGELLGVSASSNEGSDCCVDTAYTLSTGCDNQWLVEDKLQAAYVRMFSTEWYNADYDTPINPYKPEEVEVVKVTMNIKVEPTENIKLPTFDEYMIERYDTKGNPHYSPGHYESIKRQRDHGAKFAPYSFYDIKDMMWDRQRKNTNYTKVF